MLEASPSPSVNPASSRDYFRKTFGGEPDAIASAPGRVNLIGEHTDYNGGQVLPIAIGRRTLVAMRALPSASTSRLVSDHVARPVQFDMNSIRKLGNWSDYITGVCAAFLTGGARLPQIEAVVTSDVPAGSGLSSSAALEVATAVALSAMVEDGRTMKDLALMCWRVENQFVGVASGVMDQFASALCEDSCALHLWCDTLETEQVRTEEALLIFDTSVPRSLRSSQFNQRRAECEEALQLLRKSEPKLTSLAAASPEQVRDAGLPATLEKRALHVTTETRRVEEVVSALRKSSRVRGELLYESHESLRVNYECSSPELDWFVERSRLTKGVAGARLTGAGWGGCAIAVGEYQSLADAADDFKADYASTFGRDAKTWLTNAAPGARLEGRPIA
ncbi:MAG TPA: galactokinase [Gemmatimonadaceae bacterium]|nr:galactokinase [Gemmatimonadaceae bacterium]